VDVPGLNGIWENSGEINFSELSEMLIRRPEHVHDFAALIQYLT
jgi:hypothetical protein